MMANPAAKIGEMGLAFMEVTVVEVQGQVALIIDQFGKERNIRSDVLRYRGVGPQPGEKWIIDRALGFWTFAALVGSGGVISDPTGRVYGLGGTFYG